MNLAYVAPVTVYRKAEREMNKREQIEWTDTRASRDVPDADILTMVGCCGGIGAC
jgi:hypothetical protein